MIPHAQPDLPDVVIVHGWHGSPPGHWQHWLASTLAASGHRVHFPLLPNKAAHSNLDSGFGPWPWLASRIAPPHPRIFIDTQSLNHP